LDYDERTEKRREEKAGGNGNHPPLAADERGKRIEKEIEPGRTLFGVGAVYALVRAQNPAMEFVL
jgi:hypothetical protein